MIILASTSDSLRAVTNVAANIDAHASWVDGLTTITPGRTNTLIATATTTTVVGSPGASTYRTVKTLTLRNRSTSTAPRVTVVHRASGPVDAELISAVIPPGGSLAYDDRHGWIVRRRSGVMERHLDTINETTAIGTIYSTVLQEDAVANDATSLRHRDVKELGFPVVEGLRYWFRMYLWYTSAATTTGIRANLYGPGLISNIRYHQYASLTTTSKQDFDGLSTLDASSALGSSAATGSNILQMAGFIDTPTCDGFMFLRLASEIASSAITVKAGSMLHWARVT